MKWLILGAIAGFLLGQAALSYAEYLEGVFSGVAGWLGRSGWALGAVTMVVGWLLRRKGEFVVGVGAGLLGRWLLGVM